MEQKVFFSITTTKEQAKRLFFFFPNFQRQKDAGGRTVGQHPNPMRFPGSVPRFKAPEDQSFVEQNPNAPETIEHSHGRAIYTAPTTNGATYELEWSNKLRTLSNDALVYICIRKHKSAKAYVITVTESRREEADDFQIHLLHGDGRGGVSIVNKTVNKKFMIRQDDITPNAWQVWESDTWRYDCTHLFDREFGNSHSSLDRKHWLESKLSEGVDLDI